MSTIISEMDNNPICKKCREVCRVKDTKTPCILDKQPSNKHLYREQDDKFICVYYSDLKYEIVDMCEY